MTKSNKKIIYFIFAIIIVDLIVILAILGYRNKSDKKLYNEIYNDYDEIVNSQNSVYEDLNLSSNYLNSVNSSKYNIVAILTIPKIQLKYPVIGETTEELLKVSITKLFGPNPNSVGNLCIIGHNFFDNKLFSNIHKLEKNDTITLTNISGYELNYKVYDKYEVVETDLKCTSQITNGKREITLITCTKNVDKRLIIKCIEI